MGIIEFTPMQKYQKENLYQNVRSRDGSNQHRPWHSHI